MSLPQSASKAVGSSPVLEPARCHAHSEIITIEDSDTGSNRNQSTGTRSREPWLGPSPAKTAISMSSTTTARIMQLFLRYKRKGTMEGCKKSVWRRIARRASVLWPGRAWTPQQIGSKFDSEERRYRTWLAVREHAGVRYNGKTGLLEADDETWQAICTCHEVFRDAGQFRTARLGDLDVYQEVFPGSRAMSYTFPTIEVVLYVPSPSRQAGSKFASSRIGFTREWPIDLTVPDENPLLPPSPSKQEQVQAIEKAQTQMQREPQGQAEEAQAQVQEKAQEQMQKRTQEQAGVQAQAQPQVQPQPQAQARTRARQFLLQLRTGERPNIYLADPPFPSPRQREPDQAQTRVPTRVPMPLQQILDFLQASDGSSLARRRALVKDPAHAFVYAARQDFRQRFKHKLRQSDMNKCLDKLMDPVAATRWAAFYTASDEIKETIMRVWVDE